jgi:hypothetical protein
LKCRTRRGKKENPLARQRVFLYADKEKGPQCGPFETVPGRGRGHMHWTLPYALFSGLKKKKGPQNLRTFF